jgi:LmbE family N-acetylglucosaminyl deacetylase
MSMPHDSTAKLLIIGAHPDDAEFHAGGMAALYRQLGRQVRMISVTNGNAGHHTMPREELAKVRKQEAANSGRVIEAEYIVWDHDDGSLTPSLAIREQIIREIRTYQPDLVLTHRPCDYHPDHRAVGQAVQDASYLITVPHIVPEVPALRRDPVVACMVDLFTRPNPLRPDVLLDISPYLDTIEDMFACHRSQVYEWLPYNQCLENEVPAEESERRQWLSGWVRNLIRPRADHFREHLVKRYGNGGKSIKWLEAYEISEYAGSFEDGDRQRLFPFACAK